MRKYTHTIPKNELSLAIVRLQGGDFDFMKTFREVNLSLDNIPLKDLLSNKSEEDLKIYELAAVVLSHPEAGKDSAKYLMELLPTIARDTEPFVTLKEQWSAKLGISSKYLMRFLEKDSSTSYVTVETFLDNFDEYSEDIIKNYNLGDANTDTISGLLRDDYIKLIHLINNDASSDIILRFYELIKDRVADPELLLNDFYDNLNIQSFPDEPLNINLSAKSKLTIVRNLTKELAFTTPEPKRAILDSRNKATFIAKILSFEDPGIKFDTLILTREVPYARYNDNTGEVKIKLMKREKLERAIDLANLSRAILSQEDVNRMFVTVEVSLKSTSKRFATATIDFNNMEISASGEGFDAKNIVNRVVKLFDIKTTGGNFVNISGEFVLVSSPYDEITFSDLMMNDVFLNKSIFINEGKTPQFLRTTFRMGFKTELEVMRSFRSDLLVNFTALEFTFTRVNIISSRASETSAKYKKDRINGNNILVRYSNAGTEEVIRKFNKFIRSTLAYYETKRGSLLELYKKEGVDNVNKASIPLTKVEMLKDGFPELFVGGYASICQLSRQPLLVDDTWKGETIEYPNKSGHKFGCDSDVFKYPGLVKAPKTLPNYESFKFAPCCFKLNQKTNRNSKYNIYMHKKGGGLASAVVKTSNKLANPGETINLHTITSEFLKLITGKEYLRYGVLNASFPEALFATDESFNSLELDDMRKVYKEANRKTYKLFRLMEIIRSKNIMPGLLKQELYDHSEEEIKTLLSSIGPMESEIYYKLFEEIFNANIFVLVGDDDGNFKFEIPRHKFFHAREFKYSQSLVMYKIKKSYELIYEKVGGSVEFKEADTKRLINAYKELNRTTSVTVSNYGVIANKFDNYYTRTNESTMKSQIIDANGKRRGYTTTDGITVITPPSQPGNFPIVNEVTRVNYERALEFMKESPIAVSLSEDDDSVEGLWFQPLNTKRGNDFYIPVDGMSRNSGIYPVRVKHPLLLKPKHIRISTMKETVRRMVITLLTLYKHFNTKNEIVNVTQMFDEYVLMSDDGDSDYTSGTDWSYKELRNTSSVNDVFSYLESKAPKFVIGKKIRVYSERFSKGLIYMISLQARSDIGRTISITKIEDRRDSVNDNSIVFKSKATLDDHIQVELQTDVDVNIAFNRLTPYHQDEIRPYVVVYKNKRYLVQNVAFGSKRRAFNVSKTWRDEKINLGYSSGEYNGTMLEYASYFKDHDGRIVLKRGSENAGVKLLYDNLGVYSGLMEM